MANKVYESVKIRKDGDNNTRTILIKTAGRLFADQGLQVTLRQIVSAAGQSLGSIRYHFGGKEELHEAVLEFVTQGWRNHEDLIDYILHTSEQKFKTAQGRHEILRQAYDILLFFMNNNAKYPEWAFAYISRIMTSSTPPACKEKFIERVIVPNRRSFVKMLNIYCPSLSFLETTALYVNLFAGPLYHYAGTFDLQRPLPFLSNITPRQFYDTLRENLLNIAWLTLEHKRNLSSPS